MLWKSIIAAIVVILGSTFLAYKLSLFLGISVERQTWILCALMAMVCSFIAAPSTMYFPVSHLSVIVFAVIASTIFITYYNYRQAHEKSIGEDMWREKRLEARPRPLRRVRRPLRLSKRAPLKAHSADLLEPVPQAEKKAQEGVFAALFAATPEAQQDSLDSFVAAALKEDEAKFPSPSKANPPQLPESLFSVIPKSLPLKKELKKAPVKVEKAPEKRGRSFLQSAPRLSFYGFSGHLPPQEKEACRARIFGKSLDEIVNIACDYWRQRRLYQALYCLFAALRRYGDDPAALFICIEISNIYKSFGAYALAAASLRASLYLPVVRENAALQRDLREQIAYLHRLIAVLKLAGMPQIPIERVPGAFLRRADAASSESEAAAQDSSMEAI